jgi:undecaprenyl-phosphate 4-deoxy-4-formamido-L-arabinose transferase
MKVSIVIPVYNAEKTIESLCNTLFHLYSVRYDLEIVLVNDNSRDSSNLICQRMYKAHPENIIYLRLARNFGEHCAVMAGLNQVSGDLCVIMDDDFQNPPEEIGLLLEEMEKGYDVVYSQYSIKRDSFLRNLGSLANDKMANLILRKPADLYLSSFKVMNSFLVSEIIKYHGPDPYIDAIILRSTDNIGKVQVRHDERKQGSSGYTIKKLISLWGNMVVSYSLIPLRIIGIIGLFLAVYGTIMGMDVLIDFLVPTAEDMTEVETLTAITSFFRGFQMLAISVVGEYVGRIYLSLNADPQFVIREKFAARKKTVVMALSKGGGEVEKEDKDRVSGTT